MLKILLRTFVFLLIVFVSTQTAHAVLLSGGKVFAGKIIIAPSNKVRNPEISTYEMSGYVCGPDYDSFDLDPINPVYPKSYIATPNTKKATQHPVLNYQWVLGKYAGTQIVTCTNEATEDTQTISLNIITIYGTSKSPTRRILSWSNYFFAETKQYLALFFDGYLSKIQIALK